MRLDISITDDATPALRRFVTTTLPDHRRDAVETTLRDALGEIIQRNPLDTAQSRAAWVASLEELGGIPPAGWQGAAPNGAVDGRTAGSLRRHHDRDSTSAAASNAVPYAPFLEYGTSRIGPFAMVRSSLWQVREKLVDRLRRLFR